MITQTPSYLSAVDLLLILSNFGIFGYLSRMLLNKIKDSVSQKEVEKMIDDKLKAKADVLEVKLDSIDKKLDKFIELMLKNAHLKIGQ